MSTSEAGPDPASAKQQLVDQAAALHRLSQEVREERAAERQWEQRAELAATRGRPDLAEQARQQAASHRERAGYLEATLIEQQATVEELRQEVRNPSRGRAVQLDPSIAPSEADVAEYRLDQLEKEDRLEEDLSTLKAKMGKHSPPHEGGSIDPPAEGTKA